MMENTHSTAQKTMPRRDFIKKSLIGSGGLFMGMTLSQEIITPLLSTTDKNTPSGSAPRYAASRPSTR